MSLRLRDEPDGELKGTNVNKEIKIKALLWVISCLVSPKWEWCQSISGWMWMRRDDGTAPFSGWFRSRFHCVNVAGRWDCACLPSPWSALQPSGHVASSLREMFCKEYAVVPHDSWADMQALWYSNAGLWSPLYLSVVWLIILLIPNWYLCNHWASITHLSGTKYSG